MRHGILGGTFDPVHQGHLDVALAARDLLGLDRILLVPARVPSHREKPYASAAHRFAMAVIAVQPYEDVLVSDIEMEANAPSYTTTTLAHFTDRGVNPAALFFLTGADAFLEIRTWKNYPALLEQSHFVVVSRPGHSATRLPELLPELAARMRSTPCDVPAPPSILLIDAPTADVSATDVRNRVASGGSIRDLVPAAVADYILKHHLYSNNTAQGLA